MRARSRFAVSTAALLIGAAALGWSESARAERTIHSFPGVQPGPVLTADRAGNLYGLTVGSPFTPCTSCGTVFRLVPPAAKGQAWTEQTLYTFPAPGSNGQVSAATDAQLAVDAAGNVYGTCVGGGSAGYGTAWRLSPPTAPGGAWTLTVLHSFTAGSDGASPEGGVVIDHSGTLYGTTSAGGASKTGVVFSLTPPSPGATTWTETVLHAFAPRSDGAYPSDPLILSSHDTVLTGVSGLSFNRRGKFGNGEVFRLRREGTSWTYRRLYEFPGPYTDYVVPTGRFPRGPVVIDANDNIFGTTAGGGPSQVGVVFELSPPPSGQPRWTEQVIYDFSGLANGYLPQAGLVAGGSPPALFGTTSYSVGRAVDGSKGSAGQVFRLDPPASGTGPWTYTALHDFAVKYQHRPIGGYPGPLTFGLHRFLFGVTGLGEKKFSGPFVYVVSPHIPASPTTDVAP